MRSRIMWSVQLWFWIAMTAAAPNGEETSISSPYDHPVTPHPSKDPVNEANSNDREDILQRIYERLGALVAMDQQQLQRLESLEYRYARLELQTQERAESMRKMEIVLDTVKANTVFLTQGLEQMGCVPPTGIGNSSDNHSISQSMMETQSKLEMLHISVQDVRSSLGSVLDELSTIKRNITNVANITSESLSRNKQFPTTKYFDTEIMEPRNITIPKMFDTTKKLSECEVTLPADCWDVLQNDNADSGIYKIRPSTTSSTDSFNVYCDMLTRGGGWTVFQNLYEVESEDFAKEWQEYKLGFGDLQGEFWLGLHYVYQITSHKPYEILIELKDNGPSEIFAQYDEFAIGSEIEGYPIRMLGTYTGTAGDFFRCSYGQKFYTIDVVNDHWEEGSCAEMFDDHEGWWYNDCAHDNTCHSHRGFSIKSDRIGGFPKMPINVLRVKRMSLRPRERFLQSSIKSTTTKEAASTTTV